MLKDAPEEDRLKRRWTRFRQHEKAPSGLASRGDKTLQTNADQCLKFFDEILKSFESFKDSPPQDPVPLAAPHTPPPEMAATLRNLRVLREALLVRKPDTFTKKVFLFSIRVGATVRHYETYIASSLYLLDKALHLLTLSERQEIGTLLVVHESHCNGDNYRAMILFFEHLDGTRDAHVYGLLQAWVCGDYHSWLRFYNNECDPAIHAIMSFGIDRMMRRMVNCMSCAYFTYPKKKIEGMMPRGERWADFKEKMLVSWTEDGGDLVIRSRSAKKTK